MNFVAVPFTQILSLFSDSVKFVVFSPFDPRGRLVVNAVGVAYLVTLLKNTFNLLLYVPLEEGIGNRVDGGV